VARFSQTDQRQGAEFIDADLSGARFVGCDLSGVVMLRHLILATDMWLGGAVLESEQPFHPLGLVDGTAGDGFDTSVFTSATPSYAEVLDARADRLAMVRDFVATTTPETLASTRRNPHDPGSPQTVLSCLHTILEEEWEHHRYAVRDLDAIEARHAQPAGS
jgi:hypothetical protein